MSDTQILKRPIFNHGALRYTEVCTEVTERWKHNYLCVLRANLCAAQSASVVKKEVNNFERDERPTPLTDGKRPKVFSVNSI
jgi:hypothetical protein